MARYPVGAIVTVYYDPADPENCVLERRSPRLAAAGLRHDADEPRLHRRRRILALHDISIASSLRFGPRVPGRVVIIASIVGMLCLMAFFGSLIIIANQQRAPLAERDRKGRRKPHAKLQPQQSSIAREPFTCRSLNTPIQSWARISQPRHQRRRPGRNSNADARKDRGALSQGQSSVRVFYDPANPGNATLTKPATYRPNWIALAISAVSFVVVNLLWWVF